MNMNPKSRICICNVCKKGFSTVQSLMQHVWSGTHKERWEYLYPASSSKKNNTSKHCDTTYPTPEMPKILGRTEFTPTHIPIIEEEMTDYYCSRCGNEVGSNKFCTRCMTGIHVKKSKKNDSYSSEKKVKRMTGIHVRKRKRQEAKSNLSEFRPALPSMLMDVCCNCGYKIQIELGRNVLEKIFDCPKCNNRLKSRRPP